MVFSFKYFDSSHAKFGPDFVEDGYLRHFIERLKSLSGWLTRRFKTDRCKTVRNHTITFSETSEPDGFKHLPEQLWEGASWQFSITANAHGRVHGFIAGDTFFVVWIDPKHALYP
jgi:hypothetical protein